MSSLTKDIYTSVNSTPVPKDLCGVIAKYSSIPNKHFVVSLIKYDNESEFILAVCYTLEHVIEYITNRADNKYTDSTHSDKLYTVYLNGDKYYINIPENESRIFTKEDIKILDDTFLRE